MCCHNPPTPAVQCVCVCVTTFPSDIHLQSRKTKRSAAERQSELFFLAVSFLFISLQVCAFRLRETLQSSYKAFFCCFYTFAGFHLEKHPLVSSSNSFPPVLLSLIFLPGGRFGVCGLPSLKALQVVSKLGLMCARLAAKTSWFISLQGNEIKLVLLGKRKSSLNFMFVVFCNVKMHKNTFFIKLRQRAMSDSSEEWKGSEL